MKNHLYQKNYQAEEALALRICLYIAYIKNIQWDTIFLHAQTETIH